uniref:Ig-like domain-containing protein n=1 Tax=Branchiostoma floridae TaxID=7739 RepID=C3YAB5_BRAFL|eukprot:XP_002606653.1 hypothetical protein BRAFLDRAFT_126389 [Branchiostoma floridae]
MSKSSSDETGSDAKGKKLTRVKEMYDSASSSVLSVTSDLQRKALGLRDQINMPTIKLPDVKLNNLKDAVRVSRLVNRKSAESSSPTYSKPRSEDSAKDMKTDHYSAAATVEEFIKVSKEMEGEKQLVTVDERTLKTLERSTRKPQDSMSRAKKDFVSKTSVYVRTRQLVRATRQAGSGMARLLRVEELTKHLISFPEARVVAVKENAIPVLLRYRDNPYQPLVEEVRETLSLLGYEDPVKGRGVRILSIDGGGTRGVVAVETLRQLEEMSGKSIYQMFDYISGVSSGAILAILLGVYKVSLDECEELYRRFSEEIFKRSTYVGVGKLFLSHAFYDTAAWEKMLKTEVGDRLMIETVRDPACPKGTETSMGEKLPGMLLSFLITLKVFGSTEATCITPASSAVCVAEGLTSVPQNFPTSITHLALWWNQITTLSQSNFSRYASLTELDLHNNHITTINNKAFYDLPDLVDLKLNRNRLSNLSADMFIGLVNLETLRLDNNEISDIQAGTFNSTPQLKSLRLGSNKLANPTSDMFTGLGNLEYLNLYNNKIIYIQAGTFSFISELKTLDLGNNMLTNSISDMILGLGNLETLHLSNNDISDIQVGTFSLTPQLRILSLGNKLRNLSADMFKELGNLEDLQMYSNEISDIPAGTFSSTPQLTTLRLHQNKLTNLRSDMFTGLGHLETLYLSNNEINDIKDGTFNSTLQLTTLYLGQNKLTSLRCDMFTGLASLRYLWLQNNDISDIQAGTFNSTPQLTDLRLYNNKLTNLRSGMFTGLGNLQNLWLYNNEISDIQPGTFNSTPQLTDLNLHQNTITLFKADTFAQLTLLTILELDSNNIETFPMEALSKLPSLYELQLGDNKIVTLPSAAYNRLVSIRSVDIDNNPWQCDCRMLPFRQKMTGSHYFEYQIRCEGPSNFQGQRLKNISPEDLTCEEPTILSFGRADDNTVVEGGTLHLVCEASGIPTPDITVILPSGLNVTVESGGRVTVDVNGAITITNVTAADTGLYVCIAASAELGSTFATLVIGPKEPTTAEMVPTTSPPVIAKFDRVQNNTLIEGETLYLACEASGIPTPDITVILPSGLNATVESGERVTVDVGGAITITNVTAEDAGLYVCIAASPVGLTFVTLIVNVGLLEPTTTTIMVPVTSPPSIGRFDWVHNDTVVEGETMYLVCEASGIPTPDITIILPSGLNVTVESVGRVSVDEKYTITIANVTAADTGLYVCIASSPELGSTFATLVVGLKEPTTAEMVPATSPPVVVRFERVHNNTVVEGDTLHLVCKALGIPTPDITVILPSGLNVTVESGGRVTVDVNGTITITGVTAGDSGLYVCVASSLVGSTFATLVVNVKVKVTTIVPMSPVTSPLALTGTFSKPESSPRYYESTPTFSTPFLFPSDSLKQPEPALSFSLTVLIASVCGSVAGTVFVGTIILIIWCKTKTQNPPSDSTPAVLFSNASAKVTISGHDQIGQGGAQARSESLNARNSQHFPGRPASQVSEYEDVRLPSRNTAPNGEYQTLRPSQPPAEYQSLGPRKQPAEYQSFGLSRNRAPSDDLPPLPSP